MNVIICSAFRNLSAYIDRYFEQVNTLDRLITLRGDCLSLVLGYGDSTDDTDSLLFEHTSGGIGARLIDCTHNGPFYGSIIHPGRFKQLAYVANKILANVPNDADVVIWAEADLEWSSETIIALIDRLADVPCVAPMIMERSTSGFYDTFAYRKDNLNFQKYPPYHPSVNGGLVQMDSIGSCFAMNAALAKHVNIPEQDVVIGMCRQVYALGASVWLDSSLTVQHP